MKKDNTKELLQESLPHTSSNFTDEVMHKIEMQPETIPVKIKLHQQILFGFSLATLLFALLWRFSHHSTIGLSNLQVPSLPVMLGGVLFIIVAIYRFLLFQKFTSPFEAES